MCKLHTNFSHHSFRVVGDFFCRFGKIAYLCGRKNEFMNCRLYIYRLYCCIALLIMFQQPVSAQSLRDRSNMMIGKVESSGTIRDRNNMTIGHVESDGSIRDKNNMLIGKVENNGTVRNRNNMLLGKVEQDGDVRDKNNMLIGKIDSDGAVRDRNNMVVGYAKGVSKTYAAVFFFFDLFQR